MPSQTTLSISLRELLRVSSDEARSRCSTAARWRAASAASWACSITPAAIAATADTISSVLRAGRRPSIGSSRERNASGRPSEAVSGISSASLACQASGPGGPEVPGTNVMPVSVKSNWSCGTRKASWTRKRSSSSPASSVGSTCVPSRISRGALSSPVTTTTS